ncbi:MAG: hypothetical protein SGILL_005650, partial [Bacillariaceae sp.]
LAGGAYSSLAETAVRRRLNTPTLIRSDAAAATMDLLKDEDSAFWGRQLQLSMSMSMDETPKPVEDPQPTFTSSNGKLEVTLHIGPTGEAFGSPNFRSTLAPGGGFEANVLGYTGCVSTGERCENDTPVMGGPTLRVKPGDELIVHLYNDMPEEACRTTDNIGFWNAPHQQHNTNLHAHGLFIPNSENNVLETIYPSNMLTYNIKIREVQQGGTHWYHPHAEGSVSLQGGGGAAGFIIVEDLEDDIPPEIAALPEILMRIQYTDWSYLSGCPTALGEWTNDDTSSCHFGDAADNVARDGVELCRQVCAMEDADCGCDDPETQCSENVFGRPAYSGSLSQSMTVNGIENPTFEIVARQWYRLRTVYVPSYKKPIEPVMDDACEFKLLSKDGRYMPVTPRDIQSGYMFSGSRADFLIRCIEPGEYDFQSIHVTPTTYNWATWNDTTQANDINPADGAILNQKFDSYEGALATFKVVENKEDGPADGRKLDEIRPFRPARPCYAPEMRDLQVDDSFYFLQSSMAPPDSTLNDVDELYPVFRHQPTPVFDPDMNGNFMSMNDLNETDTGFPGTLKPPRGAECKGKITNEYGECYGTPLIEDFSFDIGGIVEIDYYVPQIHPLHIHVFGFQITELPEFSYLNDDYFKIGDYHDTLLVPISGDNDDSTLETPLYGKAKLRQHIYQLETDVVVHCHFYRHSDRGMVMVGNTTGTVGGSSPQVEGSCYHGLTGREFSYV